MAEADDVDVTMNYQFEKNDRKNTRYPYCIVWTPIPILSWLLPFIGHMGICTSSGIIRDFAGSYFVSEDNMGFGRPTKYWKLDVDKVCGSGPASWDKAVYDASEEYKCRPHNLCCDNCHSHVAMALNLMRYDNSSSWNMVNLCLLSVVHGKYGNKSLNRRESCNLSLTDVLPSATVEVTSPAVLPLVGVQWEEGEGECCAAFLKTWLPFLMLSGILTTFVLTLNLQ
ncbi:Transmembrane protein 222 [Merluccius polli]|uniref:Transmembrane protein 222 n=1 Tax=Merluccius polli TaxID=89951 RepID=A0AA47NVZ1_MERPO|nr:Transmembrane protein 222 [Merluccius polli]